MRSISWRNCRFSSSPAFSKQKRELMNKRISVKISQEKQYLEGLWAAYPRKGSDMAYWLSSSLRQKRPQRNRKTPVLHGGTILHKINGKPRPPPPLPRVFALRAASSLIFFGGDGGLLFHFILSKIVVCYTAVFSFCHVTLLPTWTSMEHQLNRFLTWEQQYAKNTAEALLNGLFGNRRRKSFNKNDRDQVLWARQIVGSGSLDPTWEWTSIDYTKVTQTLFTLTTCWSNMICKHSSKMA